MSKLPIGKMILVMSMVGVMAYTHSAVVRPDFFKTLKMGTLIFIKRMAQWQADCWSMLALRAATVYNQVKM